MEQQAFVTEINPPDRSALSDPVEWTLHFSERLDLSRLHSDAIVLLADLADPKILEKSDDFLDELDDGQLATLPLQLILESDEQTLTLFPEGDLDPGVYYLVVTPRLRSANQVPFNQKPGEYPANFIAVFSYGDVVLPDPEAEPGSAPGAPNFGAKPESLVLNEFLYDGKVSETDGEAFVELYGTPGGDISLYQVLLINGADGQETDRITLPPGAVLPEDGIFVIADLRTNSTTVSQVPNHDFLDQFDPQNGPDGVQLVDRDGQLVDSLVYGEGAVSTAANGFALGEGLPAADVAGGHSLSRSAGADSQNNAEDFIDLAAPSPGIL